MQKKCAAIPLAAVLLALSAVDALAQDKTMFAIRDNTKVLSDKKLSSPPVTTLKQGDSVTVVEGGNFLFLKVKLPDGKGGFVPYTSLSERYDSNLKKVLGTMKSLTKPVEQSNNESRVRTTNAVMGIRGLNATPEEQLSTVSNARPNMKAVYAMEEQQTRSGDIEKLSESIMAELEKSIQNGSVASTNREETRSIEPSAEPLPPAIHNPSGQTPMNDYLTEMEVGRVMAGRLLAAFGVEKNERATQYLSLLGTYVAQNSDFSERRFTFAITSDDGVSAYSCPGGYVLVSKGAILSARNEAELAGVLAHEIAHVGRKHILASVRSNATDKKMEDNSSVEKDPVVKARQRVKPDSDSATGATLARYLSGPNGTTISVIAAAASGLSSLFTNGLKPEVEFEADKDALHFIMRAGFSGQHYINYIRALGQKAGEEKKRAAAKSESQKGGTSVLSKTHPDFTERVRFLEQEYAKLKGTMPAFAAGTDRFKRNLVSALSTPSEEKTK